MTSCRPPNPLRVVCVQPATCDYEARTPTLDNAIELIEAHERRGHLATFKEDAPADTLP